MLMNQIQLLFTNNKLISFQKRLKMFKITQHAYLNTADWYLMTCMIYSVSFRSKLDLVSLHRQLSESKCFLTQQTLAEYTLISLTSHISNIRIFKICKTKHVKFNKSVYSHQRMSYTAESTINRVLRERLGFVVFIDFL